MESWQENLKKAKQHFEIADHMAYVSFVILKENRLLVKILNELYVSVTSMIKAMLKYEADKGRIKLYSDSILNFKTFKEKISDKYLTKEELKNLLMIMQLERQHQDSPMEFVRKNTFVIMIDDKYETLTIEKVREIVSKLRGSFNKVSLKLI
jgi:hypothetical protein